QAYGRVGNYDNYSGVKSDPYWSYSRPLFKLGFNADYAITDALRFFAQGSNILNQNNTEQNAYLVTHGASWLFGFKWGLNK
ncbi:MAG TPA: hypothetical protein VFI33_21000, partial [Puia sp.]|nr:hypothetical protein [Puia sp.]